MAKELKPRAWTGSTGPMETPAPPGPGKKAIAYREWTGSTGPATTPSGPGKEVSYGTSANPLRRMVARKFSQPTAPARSTLSRSALKDLKAKKALKSRVTPQTMTGPTSRSALARRLAK